MSDSWKRKSRLEICHVLFIDIAGYSQLTTADPGDIRRFAHLEEKMAAEKLQLTADD